MRRANSAAENLEPVALGPAPHEEQRDARASQRAERADERVEPLDRVEARDRAQHEQVPRETEALARERRLRDEAVLLFEVHAVDDGRALRQGEEPEGERLGLLRRGDGDDRACPAREPALERWYRRVAVNEIAPRLDAACAAAGTSYERLTIRGQRTRWASCSPSGSMSFNWRLLLAPAPVLDAVVWHEVCHLHVADHSPRFWSLLQRHCPDYRVHQRWLRRYGAMLTF